MIRMTKRENTALYYKISSIMWLNGPQQTKTKKVCDNKFKISKLADLVKTDNIMSFALEVNLQG